jgi:hypothetical protein
MVFLCGSVDSVVGAEGLPLSAPTFVPVDAQGDFVLMCDYTGKEVVE